MIWKRDTQDPILTETTSFFSIQRLQLQTVIRVLFILLIFLFDLVHHDQGSIPLSVRVFFITMALFISLTYLLLLKIYPSQRFLHYSQIGLELLLTTGLLFIIKTNQFLIIFLYLLSIINSTIILSRVGALIAALLSSILTICFQIINQTSLSPSESIVSFIVTKLIIYIALYFSFAVVVTIFVEQLKKQEKTIILQKSALNHQKQLKQVIINSFDSGLIALDSEGRITFCNQSGLDILNQELETPLQEIPPQYSIFNFLPELSLKPERSLKEEAQQEITYKTLTLGYTINLLKDPRNKISGYTFIFRDLTKILKQKQEIAHQKQLAQLGQLSASIAHEIRNPLAGISGSFQMIKKLNHLPEKVDMLASIGVKETERLNDLVCSFLDFARFDTLKKTTFPLNMLFTRLQSSLDHPNIIEIDPSFSSYQVLGDFDKLYQVFLNLTRNSLDAVSENPKLRITLTEQLEMIISDNGSGIPEDIQKNIFTPFFTSKTHGTGLGLPIVQKIIELHGGTISFTSSSKGTIFTLSLPHIIKESS